MKIETDIRLTAASLAEASRMLDEATSDIAADVSRYLLGRGDSRSKKPSPRLVALERVVELVALAKSVARLEDAARSLEDTLDALEN